MGVYYVVVGMWVVEWMWCKFSGFGVLGVGLVVVGEEGCLIGCWC